MSGYQHTGPVHENGYVDTLQVIKDHTVLSVSPVDDGYHLNDPVIGNFEWWYFDAMDIEREILLKIVVHIGTNPLKTSVFPQLALSVSTPATDEFITRKYDFSDLRGSVENCRIQIKNEFEARVEFSAQTEYFIMVNLPEFSAELHFVSEIEGWKPSGDRVRYNRRGRSASFMWIIPVPKAKVNGTFVHKGNHYAMKNAIGYHDYNYFSVDKKKPLYLDRMVKKWYWGKCYCEDYTMIFMDTFFRTSRLKSFFVAKGDEIIHSSNNLIDLKIVNTECDATLGNIYPSSISVNLKEDDVLLVAVIDSYKIIDRKDLLDDVPSIAKWLIKKFIARPAYYSLFARVSMEINGKMLKGYGNYEYMVFRS